MTWNQMCAACHNTRVRKNYDPATDTYHTTMAGMTVGCEACHGPMRAHADWHVDFSQYTLLEQSQQTMKNDRVDHAFVYERPEKLGDARIRFSVRFYLVAMLFLIFDLEVVFLYPWAILFRVLGLFGLIEMGIFLGILLIGFVYVWKKGALEWN